VRSVSPSLQRKKFIYRYTYKAVLKITYRNTERATKLQNPVEEIYDGIAKEIDRSRENIRSENKHR